MIFKTCCDWLAAVLQELLLKLVEEYYPLPVDPDAPPEPTPVKGSRSRKGCQVRHLATHHHRVRRMPQSVARTVLSRSYSYQSATNARAKMVVCLHSSAGLWI